MGLNGAGWATTLSRFFATIALFVYSINSKRLKSYCEQLFNIYLVKKSMVTRILKLGVPGGFQYIFETSAFALSALLIGYIGAKEQAAHQITINLASISFMVAVGLSSASAIRIGHAKGQGNYLLAKRIGYSSFLSSAMFMAICGIAFIVGREYLPSLYINDQEVIKISSQLMLIAALFQVADGIQAVGVGILRGLEDVKRPTLFVLIAYWVIALPLGALFAFVFHLGVLGIWTALALGLFISAILLSWRFSKQINRLIA
jgi:MATE family multidrug resistance protein